MRLVSSTCAVLAVASAIAACSLTTSLDGLTGGDAGTSSPDAATGGGGEDAASTSDATARDAEVVRDGSTSSSSDGASTEASLTAGPNLVTDPSFETSCNDFTAYEGDLVWTTDSRTGGHDCRACKTGSTDDVVSFDDQGHFVKNPLVGETYHAEIWVRAVLTSGLTVALIAREQQSGKQINQVGSPRVDLGTDWQLVETDSPSTRPASPPSTSTSRCTARASGAASRSTTWSSIASRREASGVRAAHGARGRALRARSADRAPGARHSGSPASRRATSWPRPA